jgi:hypothetical protein
MDKITCPNCEHRFDIEGAVASELKVQFDDQLKEESKKIRQEYKERENELAEKRKAFEETKKKENEIFKIRLESAREEQEKLLKEKLERRFQLQIQSQEKDLSEQNQLLKTYQQKEIEWVRMQRKLQDLEKDKELELEKKLIVEREKIAERIQQQMKAEIELKMLEKDKQLEDQRKLIEEMKRKSDQGSMQLQGEVQELAIEQILKLEFPFDRIEEVPKGVRGADTIHTVINAQQIECGKIIYESKRTKAFSSDWVNKLKIDQRSTQSDIALLVTETLPKEMSQFGQYNGIWVCTFQEFKSLVFVLREFLLKLEESKSAEENKGDKMELLYHFLTSKEFKLQIEGIVDGFKNLKEDLDREKRSMQTIWKRREKQLEQVISNTIGMYGSIKGIAGNSIGSIQQLELPE